MRSHNFRTDIQVARGLAIILVLLFHGFENYFSFGYLGVDIFFVISGFVVTPLLCRIFPRLPFAIGETVQLNHIYVRLKDF
jgi:peptidoglycan/LPS O-acetylase OafA/YrhL